MRICDYCVVVMTVWMPGTLTQSLCISYTRVQDGGGEDGDGGGEGGGEEKRKVRDLDERTGDFGKDRLLLSSTYL